MLLARRQLELRGRPVSGFRLRRRLCAGRVWARTPLRRVTEDLVAQLGDLLGLLHQVELELLRRRQALEPVELFAELLGALLEVLALEYRQPDMLPQQLRIVDVFERVHGSSMISARADDKIFFTQR